MSMSSFDPQSERPAPPHNYVFPVPPPSTRRITQDYKLEAQPGMSLPDIMEQYNEELAILLEGVDSTNTDATTEESSDA
jgi:hypothetical protein